MPAALPWIIGAGTIYNIGRDAGLWGPQPPTPPPTLSFQEAQQMATQMLDPIYADVLQNRLQDVARQQIRSGFFGQAPGLDQAIRTAANVEAARAGQIGQLATQLQGQTYDQAARNAALQMQAYQMALQRNPVQSAMTGLGAMGTVAELFPSAFDTFTQTMGRWFGSNAATRPVDLNTVTQAMDFWSPNQFQTGQGMTALSSAYPYGNVRIGITTPTAGTTWINPY